MNPFYLATATLGSIGVAWSLWNREQLPEVCASAQSAYLNCHQMAMQNLGGGIVYSDVTTWIKGALNSYKVSEICQNEYKRFSNCMNYPPYFMITAICSAITAVALFKLIRH